MAKYIERLKDKVKIKKFDSNQPIGAWVFVVVLNIASILEEFKEWSEDPLPKTESIWTLPDLTSKERRKNFCRSIKKEIR